MKAPALELLKQERISVLALTLPDGSPHAAVLHYSADYEPVTLYFQTYPTVKTQALIDAGGSSKASVVVGLSEEKFVELQMRGTVRIVTDQATLDHIHEVHYAKLPESKKYLSDTTIFLEFTPSWYRHTDFNTDPETFIEE